MINVNTSMKCIAACSTLLFALSANAAFTEIKPATVKINGGKYWRAKAESATLASIGIKRNIVGSANHFEKSQDAPSGIFKINVSDHFVINSSQARELGVSASASNGAATVSGSASASTLNEAQMSIYKMSIDQGNTKGGLRKETNLHNRHLTAVKELGAKARMISAVWIMVEGHENQSQCLSGELGVSEATGNYSVGVSASGCKSASFQIPSGSVVAYEMVKIADWDKQELTATPACKKGYNLKISKSTVNPKDECQMNVSKDSGVQCDLSSLDKRKNWFVKALNGRDTCQSKKDKKDKLVECVHKDDKYVSQSGKDKCVSTEVKTLDPFCPAGYDYNKKSTSSSGKDICDLKGIKLLRVDTKGS